MSRTLQNTIDWVNPILRFMPLNIGTNNEPAVTNANLILQTIIGPPFCWNWNRKVATFSTVAGQQDYTQSLTDFSFIEKATVTALSGDIKELSVQSVLGLDSKQGRPEHITAQTDDGAGSIGFRLMRVPDAVYTVTVIYQKKVPLFSALSDSWPIPDEYVFIAEYGFLFMSMLHVDDPRMGMFNQKFVSALLSTARGLSDMDKNIFVGNWIGLTNQALTEQLRTQQGVALRGQ